MDIAEISTPAYFERMGASPTQAEDLARQVEMAGARGQGLAQQPPATPLPATAVVAPAPSVAPSAPDASVLSAKAERAQLMADRASGKITNAQWNSTGSAREYELAKIIADGAGDAPAPTVEAPTDPFAVHFAPPASSSDYRFPHTEGTPTDEDIATDRAVKNAMFEARLPKSTVESIMTNVAAAARAVSANPESLQARLDSTKVRATEMWAKEGTDWDTAVRTIDSEIARWPALLQEEFRRIGPLLGPLDLNQLLQLAKFRNRTR